MASNSDLIRKEEVSDVITHLGQSASAASTAASELSSAADKVTRQRDQGSRASVGYQSSYDSNRSTYASNSSQASVTAGLEAKLAEAEDAENRAADTHAQAMAQLEGARHSAQILLTRVKCHRRSCENNLAGLKTAERQTQGTPLVALREQRSVQERNFREMTDFEQQLQQALSQASAAGQGARRSRGGSSLEGRVVGTAGAFSRSPGSIYDSPADVYVQLKRYPVETQLAADPYRMSGTAPAYGEKYQKALRGLDHYF